MQRKGHVTLGFRFEKKGGLIAPLDSLHIMKSSFSCPLNSFLEVVAKRVRQNLKSSSFFHPKYMS